MDIFSVSFSLDRRAIACRSRYTYHPDGKAHDLQLAYEQARSIKSKKVRVVTISVGQDAAVRELQKIASGPEDALSIKLTNAAFYAQKVALRI